ncbi:MAG: hypothetical protein C0434_00030 [Xanthomonadaceae bacterium]|nr:hypothetical protein [Xanthomonadaceae bacterium]
MNTFTIRAAAAVASVLCATAAHAVVVGDQLVANPTMSAYTVTPGSGYRVPDNWACTNFPRFNRRCSYLDTRLGILSRKPGNTPSSRQAAPVNPTWWQTITVPVAGLYDVEAVANKLRGSTNFFEVANQAIVITVAGVEVLSVPDSAMGSGPVGTHGPSVTINKLARLKAGSNTLSIGLRYPANPDSYAGYTFFVDTLSIRYVSP